MNIDLIIILLYLAITLGVGIVAGKGIKTVKDYALGGRNYATSIIVAATFTTWIGGETCQGLAERIFSDGLIFLVIFLGGIVNKLLIAKYIAPRIEPMYGMISIGDIMGSFYGKTGRITTGISSLILSIGYVAAQVTAIGYLCESFLGVDQSLCMLIGGGIVVAYSSYGGIKADTRTDVLQFLILIVAIPIVATMGLSEVGGYSNLIKAIPQSHTQIIPNNMHAIEIVFLFILFCSPFIDPAITQRMLMTKNTAQIRNGYLISAAIEVPFYCIVVIIALTALALKPDLHPGLSMSYVIDTLLPVGFKGLAIVGLMAVVMSTADSYLNTSGIALIHDIVNPLRQNPLSDKSELKAMRILTLVIGIIAVCVAMKAKSILDIVLNFLNLWAPVIGVPFLAGLFGIRANTFTFIAAACTGVSMDLSWRIFNLEQVLHVSAFVPGVLASAVVFFSLYKITKDSEDPSGSVLDFIRRFKFLRSEEAQSSSILNKIANASAARVRKFGAQYMVFGAFAVINYVTPLFMWTSDVYRTDNSAMLLRLISGVLCLLLIMKDALPARLKQYLPLYWHITLTYCLPFLATYMLIAGNGEIFWFLNMSLALVLLAVLVDWLTFVITLPIGMILAYLLYAVLHRDVASIFASNDLYLAGYVSIFAMSIGLIFLRNNARTVHNALEAKNLINRKLQETVEERTVDLREALSAKKEFLSKVSHEVRTPLHGIIGISRELSANWEKLDEPSRHKLANTVVENSDRLVGLMDNILDLAQFTAGKINPKFEQNINMVKLAENAINAGRTLARNKHKDLAFRLEVAPGVEVKLEADEKMLTDVLLKIIDNAVQYSNTGEIIIRIDVGPKNIKISISDEGIGIPEEERLTVFEPFTQSSRTKDPSKGKGLGLALCSEIIQLHHGQIWVEPNQKTGSIIVFNLPYHQPSSISAPTVNTLIYNSSESRSPVHDSSKVLDPGFRRDDNERVDGTRHDFQSNYIDSGNDKRDKQPKIKGKVLLVDDEDICLQMASLYLKNMGCQVVTATGGVAALKYLKEHQDEISLIFLDLMMPDMYGLNVLSEVKNDPTLKHIPVIIQSGISDPGEIAKSTRLGAAGYIPKPYVKDTIAAALRNALGSDQQMPLAS